MAVKICVAITGREETEIYRQAEAIAAERAFPEVSVVELRYDLASELPAARLLPVLPRKPYPQSGKHRQQPRCGKL